MPTKSQILREKQQAIRDHKEAERQKAIRARLEEHPLSFGNQILWGGPAFLFGAFLGIMLTAVAGVTGANYPLIFSAASGVLVSALSLRFWVKNNFSVGDWVTKRQRFSLFMQPFVLGVIAVLFAFAISNSADENVFRLSVTAFLALLPVELYFALTSSPRKVGIERR